MSSWLAASIAAFTRPVPCVVHAQTAFNRDWPVFPKIIPPMDADGRFALMFPEQIMNKDDR